jgi:ribosomal protein S1
MRHFGALVVPAFFSLGVAHAADKTVADISERCPDFKNAADKKTCKVAAKEVAKLKSEDVSAEVDLFLASIDNHSGQLILSRKRAKHMRTWASILSAEEDAGNQNKAQKSKQ